MTDSYDVIVVGARCAGAPTAMLLARQGHRVLLVDRATFPSDTVSTHLIHQPGIAALDRWGLLDQVVATGCPPIDSYFFDFGPVQIEGRPGTAYGPRRTVLDALLVDAAAAAGAEVRPGFAVHELLVEDDRVTGIRGPGGVERAGVVVGADGRHSTVARAVGPEQYHEKPPLLAGYYAYWSGLPMSGRYETYVREDRAFSAWPTNHGQTLLVGGWPYAEFEANRADVEGNFLAMLDQAPPFAARVKAARRESRFAGAFVHNYFRTPYGPGWALVGDAGYHKDPITGQGITDAFRCSEWLAEAIDAGLSGRQPLDEALLDCPTVKRLAIVPHLPDPHRPVAVQVELTVRPNPALRGDLLQVTLAVEGAYVGG